MSRWLQQQVQPKHPQLVILEVLAASYGYYQVSTGTCKAWMTKNSLSHPVLRDPGGSASVAQTLGLKVKDVLVVDRQMEVVYRGSVTTQFDQSQVLGVLGGLK